MGLTPIVPWPVVGSETVLAPPDGGEGGDRVAGRAGRRLQGRLVGAQKRVGGDLLGHRARHRRLALGAQRVDAARAGNERGVVRLHRQREARIRLRLFVAAIDARLGRQPAQLAGRAPHLLGRALEQPAAAHEEKRVAAKQRARAGEPISDVAAGMAGHVEDLRLLRAQGIALAFAHLDVDAGNAVAVGARADDRGASRLLDLEIAPGVVGMMMRVEYVREAPAGLAQRTQHRLSYRGADLAGGTGLRVVQQVDVYVTKYWDLSIA